MHFWPGDAGLAAARAEEFSIHSHGWELVSKVVLGTLEEKSFDCLELGSGPWRVFQAENSAVNQKSELRASGERVFLSEGKSSYREPGSPPIRIEPSTFHSTKATAGGLNISVAATEISDSSRSRVLSRSAVSEVEFPRQQVGSLDDLIRSANARYSLDFVGEDSWAAFVFVLGPDGQVAMARTKRMPQYWAPIGGRRKRGDRSPIDTVRRELGEELGLQCEESELIYLGSFDRDIGEGATHFWVFRLDAATEVRPDMEEFAEFEWVTPEAVLLGPTYSGVRSSWSKWEGSR